MGLALLPSAQHDALGQFQFNTGRGNVELFEAVVYLQGKTGKGDLGV